jgi:hypothetical protein
VERDKDVHGFPLGGKLNRLRKRAPFTRARSLYANGGGNDLYTFTLTPLRAPTSQNSPDKTSTGLSCRDTVNKDSFYQIF